MEVKVGERVTLGLQKERGVLTAEDVSYYGRRGFGIEMSESLTSLNS